VADRTTTLALGAAVLCGALVALQARVNGELAQNLNDALLAAVVSFGSGLVVIALVVASQRSARQAWGRLRDVPWWSRLGGLGGATLVASGAYAAPRIGVALLTVAIVAGQTTGGLLVDRAGLGPSGGHAITVPRLAGALLCVVAVVLSVAGKRSGDAHVLLLIVVGIAGLLISVQQALNGRVRAQTRDAAVTTLLNFLVGSAALVLAYLVFSAHGGGHWPGLDEWWLYIGGSLGVIFIAMAAVTVRILGVLRLGLATIAGQLVGAIVLDLVTPATGQGVAVATVVGAVLTFVAVGISGRAVRSAPVATS
jgi:transporter family-2 protein